jgi:hypothetical protein
MVIEGGRSRQVHSDRIVGLGRTANLGPLDLDGLLLPFVDVQLGRQLAS